ncbi:MAG: sulfatase [Verrucomicrobia bacterium]|nr:sulfatase [Verrucomicrobiota bacterium]
MSEAPNIVFIFADELRVQDLGYAGNPDCKTPVIDAFAAESTIVTHAVSGCSVCCPYRASLMTGQYPVNNGVYINDVELNPNCNSIARAFGQEGFKTAYIGKWHIYGSPAGHYERRHNYVPREYQMGFDYWKGFECTHDYNDSYYFFNDDETRHKWEGYDAFAQSRDAAEYIKTNAKANAPFMLMLSWGPPHFPLHTAPQEYRDRYASCDIALRPNVPGDHHENAREELRGNYAHMAALEDCLHIVLDAVQVSGKADNTIVIFTSDHGDMFGSQGLYRKCVPWDESIRVPFVIRWPAGLAGGGRELALPIDAPDIMPTLLGLCGRVAPESVDGKDYSDVLTGTQHIPEDAAALLNMPAAFTTLQNCGFKAYRGLRTARYTYVRNIDGPWLLFDNETDPYQMSNFINQSTHADLQARLEAQLQRRLAAIGDAFHDSNFYLERDGLTHYREVQHSPDNLWRDPWAA